MVNDNRFDGWVTNTNNDTLSCSSANISKSDKLLSITRNVIQNKEMNENGSEDRMNMAAWED